VGWLNAGPAWWASATWLEIGWMAIWLLALVVCLRQVRRRALRLLESYRNPAQRLSEKIVVEDYLRRALVNAGVTLGFALAGVIAGLTRPGTPAPWAVILLILGGVGFVANVLWDEPRATSLRHAVEAEQATERRESAH
jgi:hypothetical protein